MLHHHRRRPQHLDSPAKTRVALMNWRSKSSPEGLQSELRDPTSTRKGASETKVSMNSRKSDRLIIVIPILTLNLSSSA